MCRGSSVSRRKKLGRAFGVSGGSDTGTEGFEMVGLENGGAEKGGVVGGLTLLPPASTNGWHPGSESGK